MLVLSALLIAVVLFGIVPGVAKVGGWFELLFVNTLSLPFDLSDAETKAAEQKEKSELILDAVNLTYISSAGLRALLALSEATKNRISILNVCHEVYNVFDMTGFTGFFTFE